MALPLTTSPTDAAAIAADGVVFGYPLVAMTRAREWLTAVDAPDPARMRAPPNRFVHARALPYAAVGRPAGPRTGALRSSAWLDLGSGPVVLTVPPTYGRFYVLALVDAWTDVFASVGPRTTGTGPGAFVVSGPAAGPARLPGLVPIRAPTRFARIAASTQIDGDGGTAGAHAVQDAYGLRPLAPEVAASVPRPARWTPPVAEVERMDAAAFFATLAVQLRDNPARLEDRAIVERLRGLGLLSGELGWRRLGAKLQQAVAAGTARGLERVVTAAEAGVGDLVGRWRIRFRSGRYGTDYLARAAAACDGLESGPADDELSAVARTDEHGHELTGRNRYELTFPPAGLPPVHGFWTLVTYDARERLVDNPVDRYSIGDWNGLVLGADGSATIRIQHIDPGADVANWLPAPPGPFHLLLHLCWPQHEILDRRWTPPAVTPLDA